MRLKPRSGLAGNSAHAWATSALPIAANIVTTPFIARDLGVAAYGLWITALTILGTLQLLDLGFSSSLFRFMTLGAAERRGGAERYFVASTHFYGVVAACFGLLILIIKPQLMTYIAPSTSNPQVVLTLMLALVLLNPIATSAVFLMQAEGLFGRAMRATVISQGVLIAVVMGLSVAGALNLETLMLTYVFVRAIPVVPALVQARRQWPRQGLSAAEYREFFSFSRGVWVSSLSMALVIQMPILIVGRAMNPDAVGIYGMASIVALQLRNLPLFGLPPFVRELTGDSSSLLAKARGYDRRWLFLLAAYVPFATVAVLVGVPLLYGESFVAGIPAALLLLIGYIVQCSGAVATSATRQLGLVGVESLANVCSAVLFVAPLPWLVREFGLLGPGIGLVPAMALGAFTVRIYFRRVSRQMSRGLPSPSIGGSG